MPCLGFNCLSPPVPAAKRNYPQGETNRSRRSPALAPQPRPPSGVVSPLTPTPWSPTLPVSDEKVCISASNVTRPPPPFLPRANREAVKNNGRKLALRRLDGQRRVPATSGRRLRDNGIWCYSSGDSSCFISPALNCAPHPPCISGPHDGRRGKKVGWREERLGLGLFGALVPCWSWTLGFFPTTPRSVWAMISLAATLRLSGAFLVQLYACTGSGCPAGP